MKIQICNKQTTNLQGVATRSKIQHFSEVLCNCSFSHKQMYRVIPENNNTLDARSLVTKTQSRSSRADTRAPGGLRLGSVFFIRLEPIPFAFYLPLLLHKIIKIPHHPGQL